MAEGENNLLSKNYQYQAQRFFFEGRVRVHTD